MHIHFVWQDDSMDCETCGGGYADGGKVFIDGVCVVDMEPVAHCYDSVRYEQCQIYQALYEHLGLMALYTELCSKTDPYSHDESCFQEALRSLGHEVTEAQESLGETYDYDDEADYGDDEEPDYNEELPPHKDGTDFEDSNSGEKEDRT